MPPTSSAGALGCHQCARWIGVNAGVCVCVCACARACVRVRARAHTCDVCLGTVRLWGQGQAGLQREGPFCLWPTLPALGLPQCPEA